MTMQIGILARLVLLSAITVLLLRRKENQQAEYFPQQVWSTRELLPVYWGFILISLIGLILLPRIISTGHLYIVAALMLTLLAGAILFVAAGIIIGKKRNLSIKVIGFKASDVYRYVILIAIEFSILVALFFGKKSSWDYSAGISAVLYILIILVFWPVIEEAFYLGMMLIPTSRMVGLKTSAVLVSLLRALVHFDHNPSELATNFAIFGLLGCYLYIKTKRILVPLLVHSSINFFDLMRELNSFLA